MISQLKKTLKVLVISIALTAPVIATAQKLEKPVIDKFTNDTTFFTTTEKIAANKGSASSSVENIDAYASKKTGAIFGHFSLALTIADHHHFSVNQGNQILVKFADNSIINFASLNEEKSKHVSYGGHFIRTLDWACWVAEISFSVVKEDIKKLSDSAITNIRVQTNEQNYDFDIKSKDAEKIKKMFLLMVNAR